MRSTVMKQEACVICLWWSVTLAFSALGCPPAHYREPETNICMSCGKLCQLTNSAGAVKLCAQHCQGLPRKRSSTKTECPPGMYFDTALSKCDYCSSICDQHKITGTTRDCKENCPKEYASSQCATGRYYDTAVSRCEPCSSVCEQHEQRGTTDDCKKYCPKDFDKISKKSKQPKGGKAQIVTIVLSVLGAAIFVITVVGIIWITCWRGRMTDRTPPSLTHPTNHPVNYVHVACPVHAQCMDSCTVSQSSSAETLQAEEVVVEDEFHPVHKETAPLAYADLPIQVF